MKQQKSNRRYSTQCFSKRALILQIWRFNLFYQEYCTPNSQSWGHSGIEQSSIWNPLKRLQMQLQKVSDLIVILLICARVRLQIVQACKFAVFKSSHSTDYWWQRYRLTILATLCRSCKRSSNFRSLTSQIHQCWIELQMIKLELCVHVVINSSKNQSIFEWLTIDLSKGRIWNVDWFFEEGYKIERNSFHLVVLFECSFGWIDSLD